MDIALEIIKYTLPALIVFLTAFVLIRGFVRQEGQRRDMEITESIHKTTLPMRLQAYERLALFLERISPESLLMRVNVPGMTARQLQNELIASVRAEFEHNLSQQVYISSETWEAIRAARGNIINLVNAASGQVKENATALVLSQKIFETVQQLNNSPVQEALEALKKEVRQLY